MLARVARMDYLDEIRDAARKIAESLASPRVMPRHILLALISRGDEGVELLRQEGIDPDGLEEVLAKYGRQEENIGGQVDYGAGASRLLGRAGELAKGYRETPGSEFLLWALSEEDEFTGDNLLKAIGIDWEEVGCSMRRRIDSRHAYHPAWSQALIADPGLHRADLHKSFSSDVKDLLRAAFDRLQGTGGGNLRISDILRILLDSDDDGEIRRVLSGAGFDVDSFQSDLEQIGNDIEAAVAEGRVGFAAELIDALVEAKEQLSAFPAEKAERHHLLLGLLRVGEKTRPEMFAEFADVPYGPYQHAAIELIHIRRGTPKLDLSDKVVPKILDLLSARQRQEFRAIPVKVAGGRLIIGTPGYLSPHALKRIERIVDMPVEARLAPGKWFKAHCGL
jgi:ATP-dependent Clp protease ATP-binding subunit ClpA